MTDAETPEEETPEQQRLDEETPEQQELDKEEVAPATGDGMEAPA